MKIRFIFTLFAVFAYAVCMAMPNVGASVVTDTHWDDDVGLSQGMVVAPNSTAVPFMEPTKIGRNSAQHEPPSNMDVCITENRTHVKIPVYWSGGDTKASRCEAVYGKVSYNYANTRTYLKDLSFGKDIRRLSSEAKA